MKRYFRNQAVIDVVVGQGGIRGNEARGRPISFNQADAVDGRRWLRCWPSKSRCAIRKRRFRIRRIPGCRRYRCRWSWGYRSRISSGRGVGNFGRDGIQYPAGCRRRRSQRGCRLQASSVSTISVASCGPREVPRIVPPLIWMPSTRRGGQLDRRMRRAGSQTGVPKSKSEPPGDAVMVVKAQHDGADDVVDARANAPARHIPQRTSRGLKKIVRRGPAISKAGGVSPLVINAPTSAGSE